MSGGKKFDGGKARIHLIPTEAINGMAMAFGMGADKYGAHNFREGINYTRIIDSLMRHTLAYLNGEENDPESGYPHTWHIGCNFAMLEYMRVHHPELDDRPEAPKKELTPMHEVLEQMREEVLKYGKKAVNGNTEN